MAVFQAKIIWIGDSGLPSGNFSTTLTPSGGGQGNINNFGVSMSAHTLCNRAYNVSMVYWDLGPIAPEAGANVDVKATIYFRDPSDQKVGFITYPAPIAADIEETSGGKRIKNSAVVAIVGYLNTLLSTSYVPLYGTYRQRV
jgi:hypothetical protein